MKQLYSFRLLTTVAVLTTVSAATAQQQLPFADAVIEHMRCDVVPSPLPFLQAI